MATGALPVSSLLSHAAQLNDEEEECSDDDDDDDELFDRLAQQYNCNVIRREIQRFLAEKTMTQTAFLRTIEANSNSFRRFMGYKQPYQGSDNSTYEGALKFFHKLELKTGRKIGVARRGKAATTTAATTSSTASARGTNKQPKMSRAEQKAQEQQFLDKIDAVTLEEPVYVFDDCDVVRKNIYDLLASNKVTQSTLLRHLDVNSNSLRRFLTSKGKREGCSNGVYLKAYRFFEQLRIAEGRPKSKRRQQNEDELPTGFSLKRDPTHVWVLCR
ncbi:hypothetical protein PINS_up010679 [Pythium insidiosum]|nr:hypothetical protein PINS_up010679 [Pythium insidiosum]